MASESTASTSARVAAGKLTARESKAGRTASITAVPPSPTESKEKSAGKTRDNAVMLQLTKTKMCAFFERGKCASTNCRYAHSEDELRTAPNLQKTKLCRAFIQGECNLGERCMFAHGETDLRVTEGIYKTQMCNFFERGYCKKGDRCNHAHGAVDLRPMAPAADVDSPATTYGTSSVSYASSPASPPSASTPMRKSSARSADDRGDLTTSAQQLSPLPLSELLVGKEADISSLSPPQRSVIDIAAMSMSPMQSPQFWGQYNFAQNFPASHPVPPRSLDPIDILVDQRLGSRHVNVPYDRPVLQPYPPPMLQHMMPPQAPMLSPLMPSPLASPPAPQLGIPGLFPPPLGQGLYMPQRHVHADLAAPMPLHPPPVPESWSLAAAGQQQTPEHWCADLQPSALLGCAEPQQPIRNQGAKRDPVAVDLTERLAGIDAQVRGLTAELCDNRRGTQETKSLHKL